MCPFLFLPPCANTLGELEPREMEEVSQTILPSQGLQKEGKGEGVNQQNMSFPYLFPWGYKSGLQWEGESFERI